MRKTQMEHTFKTYNRESFHGGDLNWAKKNFGDSGHPWIDISTGINPHAYPTPEIPEEVWSRLPASQLEKELLTAARTYYDVPELSAITACPGTQSALQRLPNLRKEAEVAILSPTYSEHAKCWRSAGHQVFEITRFEEIPPSADVVVIVSPNNPTGTTINITQLKPLQKHLSKKGGWLVLDEAFMDMTPEQSACAQLQNEGVIIFKSFGKFFGLAGLRLGFAIGDQDIVSRLREEFGPWAVSGPASYIGEKALNDKAWIKNTRLRIQLETTKLTNILEKNDLGIIGGTTLFTLVKTQGVNSLFEHLCQRQILTRPFPEQSEFIRFGLPGSASHLARLEHALAEWQTIRPDQKVSLDS